MSFSHLRPLGFGELLDGAFTLYRRHFPSLVLTALLPALPVVLIYVLVGVMTTSPGLVAGAVGGLVILYPVMLLASLVSWAALTYYAARAYTGTPVTAKEALKAALSRILPLMGVGIVSWLLMAIGFMFCVVPGVFAACGCFAVVPAVMLERRGVNDSLTRSFALVKGAWGEVFLVLMVAYLIVLMPSMFIVGGSMFAGAALGGNPGTALAVQAVTQVVAQLVNALTTPFYATAIVLLYYDRRVRTEALDVQMMAESLAGPGGPEYPAPGGPAPNWG